MQFQIEVRPRSRGNRGLVAYYHVDAPTELAALEEAKRRFREQDPDKDVADCEFRVVP